MTSRPLVIVGAGPAGMAAAIVAAEAGLRPTVIDENPLPGGQIYRQPATAHQTMQPSIQSATAALGQSLLDRFRSLVDRMEVRLGVTVWGLFPPRRLAISSNGGWEMLDAEHLLLAPGAYEFVPPFPGWTLPGVMTPGGAQLMVKTMKVLPGKRVLLAGTGPFLHVVALQLQRAGMEVLGIAEASGFFDLLRALPRLMAQPGMLWEGVSYLRQLRRAGIPLYRRHIVVEARGKGEVQEVLIAPCDGQWRADRDRVRSVAVDTLCVGYGFVPRVQLAVMAGCRLRFADQQGGWIPEVDDNLQTSVGGIWVAGDGGGVAGAVVAELEGEQAALAIAVTAGKLTQAEGQRRQRPLLRRLTRLRRFRAALDRVSAPRPGLQDLAMDSTIVCRCEELTRSEVETGISAGGTDIRTLKVMTRLGMGACQGRMCWPAVSRLIAAQTAKAIEEVGPLSVRPPIMPLSIGELAKGAS